MGLLLSPAGMGKIHREETSEIKTPVTVVPVTYKSVASTVSLPATATYYE